ncbi:MAG: hypothetical protein Ta2G_08460 [Termitinemataceae bacterium]|nr:MAG: hypothetical protein Ta2G_08460 [Termitinemataceae bacterium]
MGRVLAEITLINAGDKFRAECGKITEAELRQKTLTSIVDTGATTLIINALIQKELGLKTLYGHTTRMANGDPVTCKVAESVEIHWKDRRMTCEPWVLDGAPDVLLGVIQLENMDLTVEPTIEQLVGRHGDEMVSNLYSVNDMFHK